MRRSLSVLLITVSLVTAHLAQNNSRILMSGVVGPVRSVRIEAARFVSNGDTLVEEPRVLTVTEEVNENGTMSVYRAYRSDGSVFSRNVRFCLLNGSPREILRYAGEDVLLSRELFHNEIGGKRLEKFEYESDGSVRSHEVKHLNPGMNLIGGERRDKNGDLIETAVAHSDSNGRIRQTRVMYKDGKVVSKVVSGNVSANQNEVLEYDASDVLTSRMLLVFDHKSRTVERATYDAEGRLKSKDHFGHEDDSHGNWTKQVHSKWNSKTAKLEPFQVAYRTITYYK